MATERRVSGIRPKGRRAVLATVDYTLAKRALLNEVRTGMTSWTDICDAHPELMRAAKHVGEQTRRDCPVCSKTKLRLVTYVYGDGLREENGRVWPLDVGLSMAADRPGSWCYVVEVCVECHWNHLSEAFVARAGSGRLSLHGNATPEHPSFRRRSSPPR